MFKNRALQLKMVKTTDSTPNEPFELKIVVPEETASTMVWAHREITKNSVIAAVSLLGAAAVAYTLSQIAIDKATSND